MRSELQLHKSSLDNYRRFTTGRVSHLIGKTRFAATFGHFRGWNSEDATFPDWRRNHVRPYWKL